MSRSAQARIIDRAASGAITFDAAIETYMETGDAEDLLEAAAVVLGSDIPLDEEKAHMVALITGCPCMLEDYDDAARAVRRWFAQMAEPARGTEYRRPVVELPSGSRSTYRTVRTCGATSFLDR